MRIFADDKVQLEMKRIRLVSAVTALMVTFMSCGNKSRQAGPIIYDEQSEVEPSDPDTTSSSVQDEGNKVEEKPFLTSKVFINGFITLSQVKRI